MQHWHDRMHMLAVRMDLEALFGLDAKIAASLTGEIAAASRRAGLGRDLAEAIRTGVFANETLGNRIQKSGMICERLLNDFVHQLGMDRLPVERRPRTGRDGTRPIFTRAPAPDGAPELSERPRAFEQEFLTDWRTAYRRVVEDNTRHTAGMEGDPVLNERLGRVLTLAESRA